MSESVEPDPGYNSTSYFELVERGLLEADDHVELLEGLVVASPPQSPFHASALMTIDAVVRKAIGERASVRVQMPLVAGARSVPEPDIAVVSGGAADYRMRHPTCALLVIEVADSSLPQDRLTKSRIYARAGVVEYWIVNLRDRRVEIHRRPDRDRRLYSEVRFAGLGDVIEPVALDHVTISVADLIPGY